MGSWDYRNIGASAKQENKKHVEKIFEYLGYDANPEYVDDGDECSFHPNPDVYCCDYSGDETCCASIDYDAKALLYLLNALFPQTTVYVHQAKGNNTSDTWENHDEIYDTNDMTYYAIDKYTDYGGWGPNGKKMWKTRFILKPPEKSMIDELIQCSQEDGNEELTFLLETLKQRLKEGMIIYGDDKMDKRIVGEMYDIIDEIGETEGSVDEEEM